MQRLFKELVNYIVHIADPEEVILFGSFAKGMETVQSDIDLLIISEKVYNRRRVIQEIWGFIMERGFKSDIIFITRGELMIAKNNPTGFLTNALKQQQKIYKKTSAIVG